MYGLSWILFAVKIAAWTAGGASAGAAALPSGRICATAPPTTMSSGLGVATGATGAAGVGTGVGVGNAAPPEPFCASAALGRIKTEVVANARANARRENKLNSSFVGLRG